MNESGEPEREQEEKGDEEDQEDWLDQDLQVTALRLLTDELE